MKYDRMGGGPERTNESRPFHLNFSWKKRPVPLGGSFLGSFCVCSCWLSFDARKRSKRRKKHIFREREKMDSLIFIQRRHGVCVCARIQQRRLLAWPFRDVSRLSLHHGLSLILKKKRTKKAAVCCWVENGRKIGHAKDGQKTDRRVR